MKIDGKTYSNATSESKDYSVTKSKGDYCDKNDYDVLEKRCSNCHYATKMSHNEYRCRRRNYDIDKKTCFAQRKEQSDAE